MYSILESDISSILHLQMLTVSTSWQERAFDSLWNSESQLMLQGPGISGDQVQYQVRTWKMYDVYFPGSNMKKTFPFCSVVFFAFWKPLSRMEKKQNQKTLWFVSGWFRETNFGILKVCSILGNAAKCYSGDSCVISPIWFFFPSSLLIARCIWIRTGDVQEDFKQFFPLGCFLIFLVLNRNHSWLPN